MSRVAVRTAVGALWLASCAASGQWEVVGGPREAEPAPAAEDERRTREVEREPLGEAALVTRRSDSPVVTARVVFAAGSSSDPEGEAGLTRLAAHLMVEGGAGGRSRRELLRRLYPAAAELGVHVGRDQTAFVLRVHRDHLDAALPIFEDVLARPRMGGKHFRRLRAKALSELTLELRGNDDEALGKEMLQAMLYEDHPYGHPPLGTERGLRAASVRSVRAQRRAVLCGGRAVVALAGDFPRGLDERLRRRVDGLRFDECVGRAKLPDPRRMDAPRMWIVHKPEAGSVAISMGLHTRVDRSHPDYPALVLAAAYLGQHRQFIGVLMRKMRSERGLNYGDYAYAEHFEQAGWSRFPRPNVSRRQQYFSIWIRPVPVDRAHFALRLATRELKRFVEQGITEPDLVRVRRFVSRYYAQFLQTESRRLGFAIDDRFYGVEEPWLERLRRAWGELTAAEVNAAIERHIDPSRLQIAAVHPDAAAFADAVAGGEPSEIDHPGEVPESVRREDREIARHPVGVSRERIRILPVEQAFR